MVSNYDPVDVAASKVLSKRLPFLILLPWAISFHTCNKLFIMKKSTNNGSQGKVKGNPSVKTQRPPQQYMGKKMRAHMKMISTAGGKRKRTPTLGGRKK